MRFKIKARFHGEGEQELNPVVKHWILLLLVEMGGVNEFVVHDSHFRDDNLARALGLGYRMEDEEVA